MQELQTITIKEYLVRKGIAFRESGKELIVRCLFSNCDKNSQGTEAHLYFNKETGQYDCKKCGATGNIVTLAKHFGDGVKDIALNPITPTIKKLRKPTEFNASLVEACNLNIPDHISQYLNTRGITDELVSDYKLGWGEFYGKYWITIPIANKDGIFEFFKLRKDPDDNSNADKFKFWPTGSEATIYGWETLKEQTEIVICEGEFDRLILIKNGIPAITSTAGAGTFKEEWINNLKHLKKIYVCYDKDKAGESGAEKVIKMINEELPRIPIYKITLPERMTDGKDLTDYFVKYNGTPDELMFELPKQLAGGADITKFKPLTTKEIIEILGLTIKKDEENKLVTFLCQLSAYTENCQFNISFNAPSSTGKSFIPLEVSTLFPDQDLIKLGNCSPTAFFHEQGKFDKEKNIITVDLSRKILIFLDQPHNLLLERLRSLFSHDEKEMQSKITDKNQTGGNKTKTVIIRGFPSVIFCSAGLKIDEQEGTRFLLLSPETGQEKFRQAIHEKIKKEANNSAYKDWLNSNPERLLLKERIKMIRAEKINDIKLLNPEKIEKIFLSNKKCLKPRHNRDIGRLIQIIKSLALLNLWFREREGDDIVAIEEDVRQAVELWDKISEAQEYNIPPYIYNLYKEVIVPAFMEKNSTITSRGVGISRKELMVKHMAVYGRMLNDFILRSQIVPTLEASGLIIQEPDLNDKRKILISPTTPPTISTNQNNSEASGGVNPDEPDNYVDVGTISPEIICF